MRFWDSSAIVPLLTREPSTASMRTLLQADDRMAVWWATRVECLSALFRRQRSGNLDERDLITARAALDVLAAAWVEIAPATSVRATAERILATRPMRAADALQLASALTWRDPRRGAAAFVCLDHRLIEAAAREGFEIQPSG